MRSGGLAAGITLNSNFMKRSECMYEAARARQHMKTTNNQKYIPNSIFWAGGKLGCGSHHLVEEGGRCSAGVLRACRWKGALRHRGAYHMNHHTRSPFIRAVYRWWGSRTRWCMHKNTTSVNNLPREIRNSNRADVVERNR